MKTRVRTILSIILLIPLIFTVLMFLSPKKLVDPAGRFTGNPWCTHQDEILIGQVEINGIQHMIGGSKNIQSYGFKVTEEIYVEGISLMLARDKFYEKDVSIRIGKSPGGDEFISEYIPFMEIPIYHNIKDASWTNIMVEKLMKTGTYYITLEFEEDAPSYWIVIASSNPRFMPYDAKGDVYKSYNSGYDWELQHFHEAYPNFRICGEINEDASTTTSTIILKTTSTTIVTTTLSSTTSTTTTSTTTTTIISNFWLWDLLF